MLLILVLVWAALVLVVCAICAAGGAADDRSEKWHRLQGDDDALTPSMPLLSDDRDSHQSVANPLALSLRPDQLGSSARLSLDATDTGDTATPGRDAG